jgi:hypothetical protein
MFSVTYLISNIPGHTLNYNPKERLTQEILLMSTLQSPLSLRWIVRVGVVLTLLNYIFKAQQVTISILKEKSINSKNFTQVETKET